MAIKYYDIWADDPVPLPKKGMQELPKPSGGYESGPQHTLENAVSGALVLKGKMTIRRIEMSDLTHFRMMFILRYRGDKSLRAYLESCVERDFSAIVSDAASIRRMLWREKQLGTIKPGVIPNTRSRRGVCEAKERPPTPIPVPGEGDSRERYALNGETYELFERVLREVRNEESRQTEEERGENS